MILMRRNYWMIIVCMAIMSIVFGCGDGSGSDDGDDDSGLDPLDIDNDGDGVTENQGDCNDADVSIYPGASEICGDSVDQDCNGSDLSCSTASGTYGVVDTGQDNCFNYYRKISCPEPNTPLYGQDGQYDGNKFSYRDNGDGTEAINVRSIFWVG